MKKYDIVEYDKAKTKILRYVLYKKRTEAEALRKFEGEMSKSLIKKVVKDLKENGYIDDQNYIRRSFDEYMALKNMSICEIKHKLFARGIKLKDFEKYAEENQDKLIEYEKNSAKKIVEKRLKGAEDFEIKRYLINKGYGSDSISEAIEYLHENED